MKQKLYIFFTADITIVGGCELYVAGKARYLQEYGWRVVVFCDKFENPRADIPYMNQYVKPDNAMEFIFTPPYKFKRYEQEFCLNLMYKQLNISDPSEYEILIESHHDAQAYWAEILASVLGARHFFAPCDEFYRKEGQHYKDNLDFFYFKWKRNEIADEFDCNTAKIFNGYKNVTEPLFSPPVSTIREQDAVQDVNFQIENIERLDWNICHIGRIVKEYVPHLIKGVGELARRHPDKTINFIMVGKADERMNLIEQTFEDCPNVLVTLLGNMVPIPRILFSRIDVVCAISQSALFAANEGTLTICATTVEINKTPGVLGYDTEESMHGKPTFSYVEALENVLLKRLYDGKKSSLPKIRPAEEYYDLFWSIVDHADPKKEYYVERLTQSRIRNWTAIFPFGKIARGARIILFGETEVTDDYRKQIESQKNSDVEFGKDYVKHLKSQPYCQILATVDEHPEEFDNTVVGMERLKVQDYDAIVVCVFPQNIQAACEKIVQVVPEAADKIISEFEIVTV